MNAADVAVERFDQGYSCSQSVFSACAELRGVDLELALRIPAGLGGGVARTAQVCGCVTGAILAIGLAQRSVSPGENRAEREKTYETGQRFIREFAARHGSTVCRELLGCDISTPEGLGEARERDLFKMRCRQYVRDAVEIVEEILSGAN